MQNLVLSFVSYGQLGQRRTILQKNVNGHLYSGQSFNSEDVLLVFPPLVRSYVSFFNVLSTLPRDEDKARKAPFHQRMRSFTFLHPSTFSPGFSARLRNESRCPGRDVKELPGQGTSTCMPQLRPGAAKQIANKYFFKKTTLSGRHHFFTAFLHLSHTHSLHDILLSLLCYLTHTLHQNILQDGAK